MSFSKENCRVIMNATYLAWERGLPGGKVKCLNISSCNGDPNTCAYNKDNNDPRRIILITQGGLPQMKSMIEKFYERLQAWKNLRDGRGEPVN